MKIIVSGMLPLLPFAGIFADFAEIILQFM